MAQKYVFLKKLQMDENKLNKFIV